MVVVAGDVPGLAIGDTALLPAERVPDAWPASIFVDGALNLIARRGDAPDEHQCGSGSRMPGRLHEGCSWLAPTGNPLGTISEFSSPWRPVGCSLTISNGSRPCTQSPQLRNAIRLEQPHSSRRRHWLRPACRASGGSRRPP